MKKLLVVLITLLLIVLFTNVTMAAQEQTVTVNPFGLLLGTLNAQYERPIGNEASLLVNGSFLSWELLDDRITGIGVGAGYRKYLGDDDFKGLFGQGVASVNFVSAPDISATAFSIEGLAGFKWIYDQGFTVEAGGGARMMFGKLEGYSGFGGFSPILALSLGYTW